MAAERGLSVMMIDRRRSVGMPPRCAGYVPFWLKARTRFDESAVLQPVEGVRFVGMDGAVRKVKSEGFILDRTRFDKTLAIRALEAGADLANAMVLKREGSRVVGRRGGLEADFEGQFILGADGPGSVVGKSVGLVNHRFWVSMQYEVGLKTPEAWLTFFRLPGKPEGVAWFVPCGRTARLGVTLSRPEARYLKHCLTRFLHQMVAEGLVFDGVLSYTGGLLPVNGSLDSMRAGHVLLAGDAGGLSEPFGGAGIAKAVVSGEVAGDLVGRVLTESNPGLLDDYDQAVKARMPVEFLLTDFEQLADRQAAIAAWCGSYDETPIEGGA